MPKPNISSWSEARRAPRRLLTQPAVPVRHPCPVPSPVLFKSGTGFPVGAAGVGGLFFGDLLLVHGRKSLFFAHF
jgi:hypothetical protein